jgi:LPS sulfotransferase NodH
MPSVSDQPTYFAILSMARSGSTHLVELLNKHPDVASNGEILNDDDASGWKASDRRRLDDDQLIRAAFTDFPVRGHKRSVQAVGCKLLDDQLRGRPSTLTALAQLPSMRFIVLERQNQFECMRSIAQAALTGQWFAIESEHSCGQLPRARIDPRECLARFQSATDFYSGLKKLLGREVAWVYYEELRDQRDHILQSLWRFLSVDRPEYFESPLKRQESRSLADSVTNFDELGAHFAGTRYEHYLFE